MLRYRVINGATSFEMLTDRQYVGRVALWGETVLFKDVTSFKHKGEPVYRRGVWVGKSSWSDSHICLTRSGAVEARSIRRLPEQFDGHDADPLPWTPVAIFGPRHSYEDKVCSATTLGRSS